MLAALKKCLAMLTPRERWQWAGLIPLTIAVALMEVLGAAIVLWFIKLISAPSQFVELPMVRVMYQVLPRRDGQDGLLYFTAFIALFSLFKNSMSAVGIYVQHKTVSQSIASLSDRMLRGYLTLPYALYLRRNSADLIHNLTTTVGVVFSVAMISAVCIASEVFVVLGILTVLLATTPLATLGACVVLGGLSAALLKLTQRAFLHWGGQLQVLGKGICRVCNRLSGA